MSGADPPRARKSRSCSDAVGGRTLPAWCLRHRRGRPTFGVMLEIPDPGRMARALELDLVRFEEARRIVRMPVALEEIATALARVAQMLRQAEERGQAVDVGDEVVLLIERFRGALRTVGGEPAQA